MAGKKSFFTWAFCLCVLIIVSFNLFGETRVNASQEQEELWEEAAAAAQKQWKQWGKAAEPSQEQWKNGADGAQKSGALEQGKQRQGKEAMWQNQQNQWVQGSFTEAIANASDKGTVVVLSDVMLTEVITISKSVVITSYDENAPCTIKTMAQDTDDSQSKGRIFTVTGGELRLQDIILDGGKTNGASGYHPLVCVNGSYAILRMIDGAVLQNGENKSQSMCGGGVNIRKGQLFMYEGSKILNCKARHGGGVEVNSSGRYQQAMFGMAGGSIDGCEADCGGGVYVNIGMFQMMGGEITGNSAVKEDDGSQRTGGGGIYVAGTGLSTPGAVLINGGRLTGNKGANGGGILVQSGYSLLQMQSGTLEGNTAKNGGGISIILGTMKLYGGTVTGNTAVSYGGGILGCPNSVIELKGNPKVSGNTAGDTKDRFDNLYLDGADDDTPPSPTSPIRLCGPLTDGVELGMSRWVCPDDGSHPYRDMIVPYNYTISQDDFARLCDNRESGSKGLYADNMDKYALIPYDGKIVMVLAVDIKLNKDSILFDIEDSEDLTASLTAAVTPDNAPLKDVEWTSSDTSVATVDENGTVTRVGLGKAVIKATTSAPYHAYAPCDVIVAEIYQITYKLEEGQWKEDESNPSFYTSESDEIILHNPVRSGYNFVGWIGTDLTEPTLTVKIPKGSVGEREYTAVWEKAEEGSEPAEPTPSQPSEQPEENKPEGDKPENNGTEDGGNVNGVIVEAKITVETETIDMDSHQETVGQDVSLTNGTSDAGNSKTTRNPRTGSYITWLFAAAVLSALCMLILTFWKVKRKKSAGKKK